jgi:outer membrane protein TolC
MLPTDVNSLRSFIERSLASRPDLLASRKRVESARVLTVAARNQLLPQVNLVFSTGYSGLKEGRRPDQYFGSIVQGIHGPDAAAGVQYQFPLANNFAQGQLVQAEAGVKQAQSRVDDVSRSISAAVAVALNGVQAAKLRLDKARESVDYYQTALNGERDKYRLGIGSLVDVLTIEDRLTNATVGLVQAQLAFARVLIDFRFATGTIVAPESISQSISNDVFLTLPFTGTGPEQKK